MAFTPGLQNNERLWNIYMEDREQKRIFRWTEIGSEWK